MIGKTIGGRYEIVDKLGEQAFGETYRAKDKLQLNHPLCVVKRLKPENVNPTLLQVFEQEAKILQKLGKHDQIPRLLAYFDENQEFYLVQEFTEGHDLSQELPPGKRLTEVEVIALLQGIMEVLEFVHKQDVIHQDIKPSNIIIRQKDGKIVLTGFGAIEQISAQTISAQEQVTLTIPNGTLGYIPLEQFQGKPKLSSDVYAVGMIAIKALTGIPDHQLPHTPNIHQILSSYRVNVSTKLSHILDKMVRFDYQQRYQSATEVLQALKDLTAQKNWLQAYKFPLLGAIAAIVAALIAQFGSQIRQWYQPPIELADYSWSSENSADKITMKYPKDWRIEPGAYPSAPDIGIFESPQESDSDTFRELVIINIVNLEKPILLNKYTDELITGIKEHLTDFNLIEPCKNEISLASSKTNTVCYTGKESGRSLKYLLAVTLTGNKAYYFTYIAEPDKYEKFFKPVKEMIESFEIVENLTPSP